MVVLAVKPGVVPEVLREIEPHLKEDALVVSIAAGIPLATLEQVSCDGEVAAALALAMAASSAMTSFRVWRSMT